MKTTNNIGSADLKKLVVGLIVLWGIIIGGCATSTTVPGTDVAAGVFEQAGFEFMRWEERADGQRPADKKHPAAIMIWHDFLGDSGSFSESKRALYTLQGYAESRDGARFEWEVRTSDGETLQFWLDGQPYDLSNGAVFIVRRADTGPHVTQLDRDLSDVQPNASSCVAFAKNDPDLARFIDEVSGASPTPTLAITPTPQTSASASDVASPIPSPTPPSSTSTTKLEPQRIRFAEGGTSATVHDILLPTSVKPYVLRALAGQMLEVDIVAPIALGLSITGENGTLLVQKQVGEADHWEGQLPATQDYVIKLASPDTSVAYDLTITIPKLTEPVSTTSTYHNAEHGFEVRYPPDFGVGMTCPNVTVVPDPVISFRLVGDLHYANTNLLDACVTVGVDRSATGQSTCMEARGAYNEDYVGQEEINAILFTKVSRGGVAAGHIHDVTIYRTLRDDVCYAITLFLHYSNIGVYEPGTVAEFDKDSVMQKLAQVLYTFRFTGVRGGDDSSTTDTASDWGVYTHHAFGVSLGYPASWQPDEQSDGTKFVGPNGFFHISAMDAESLDEAVASETVHPLQPYGSQPTVERLRVGGQEARLILPSDDQPVAMEDQAALIVRYPYPIDLSVRPYEYEYFVPGVGGGGSGASASGQSYAFFVLWADQSHIRTIARSVRFIGDFAPDETSTSMSPITWRYLPPGLAYGTSDGVWLVGLDEQPVRIHDDPQAYLFSDGRRFIRYDAAQQDAWLINRAADTAINLTRTPGQPECCFQWWPQRPDFVLFGSAVLPAAQPSHAVRYYLTLVGVDGEGYRILDAEHPINVSGADGTLAFAPHGRTIAYGVGSQGWFYHWDGPHGTGEIEPFDPVAYGLDLDAPFQIAQPAWSPDGTHLAWIVKENVRHDGVDKDHPSSDWTGVAVFDLAARTGRMLHQYPSQGVGWPSAPVWSPDGQWLAFGHSSPSENAGLWVARMGDEVVLHHLGSGGNPVWSPDGQWLAFQSMAQDGPPVYTLAARGVWEHVPLGLPVDRLGQLVAWVNLGAISGSVSSPSSIPTPPGLAITGTVMDVSLSARLIMLQTPVEGFGVIALTEESELRSADGREIGLRDLQPGEIIQAFGRPGESSTLIASQVLVLDVTPTPPPEG